MATAQQPDYLIYESQKFALHSNPLETLFEKDEELWPKSDVVSSGNWRGYVATFAVQDEMLVIEGLTIQRWQQDDESVLEKVFPEEADRVLTWYSGLLIVPTGERTAYVHLAYASRYESYLLLRVRNGRITETVEMAQAELMDYRRRQFIIYKKTEKYRELFEYLREGLEPGDDFDIEGFIFQEGSFTQEVDLPFSPAMRGGRRPFAR